MGPPRGHLPQSGYPASPPQSGYPAHPPQRGSSHVSYPPQQGNQLVTAKHTKSPHIAVTLGTQMPNLSRNPPGAVLGTWDPWAVTCHFSVTLLTTPVTLLTSRLPCVCTFRLPSSQPGYPVCTFRLPSSNRVPHSEVTTVRLPSPQGNWNVSRNFHKSHTIRLPSPQGSSHVTYPARIPQSQSPQLGYPVQLSTRIARKGREKEGEEEKKPG